MSAAPPFNIEVRPCEEDPSMWRWDLISDRGRRLMTSDAAYLDDLDCFLAAKELRQKMARNAAEIDSYVS